MRVVIIWVAVLSLCVGGCGDDDGGTNQPQPDSGVLCGNGTMEGIEECDDGVANSDSEPDACRTDCRLPYCGDGVVDDAEVCDDGPQNSDEVPDACRPGCTEPICGDLVVDVQHGESCDDGNDVDGDGCSAQCLVEYCGNGVLDPDEECDDGNIEGGDGCSADCSSNEECGNGIIDLEAGENCDGGELLIENCQVAGYYAGTLTCDAESCSMDFSTCTNCIDPDNDLFGEGPACLGVDCDSSVSSCWAGYCCMAPGLCWDADGDGYGNYPGCLGPDCDETNDQCHSFGDACCPATNGNAGSPCTDASQCTNIINGTPQCGTAIGEARFPGGYCTSTDCMLGAPCDNATSPGPALCRQVFGSGGGTYCVKTCVNAADCRASEGYRCRVAGYCWYETAVAQ